MGVYWDMLRSMTESLGLSLSRTPWESSREYHLHSPRGAPDSVNRRPFLADSIKEAGYGGLGHAVLYHLMIVTATTTADRQIDAIAAMARAFRTP